LRRRANVGHGVVSTGAPTPGLLWVSPPGDYAIVNSNHISDGTQNLFRTHSRRRTVGMVNGTVWLIWIVLIEERSFFAVSLVVAIRDTAG
jgi:hypothetical protein